MRGIKGSVRQVVIFHQLIINSEFATHELSQDPHFLILLWICLDGHVDSEFFLVTEKVDFSPPNPMYNRNRLIIITKADRARMGFSRASLVPSLLLLARLASFLVVALMGSAMGQTPPTITSPGGTSSPGPIESDLTPTFMWNGVSGATGYGLYIRDVTTNTLIYNNPGGAKSGTSFTLPSGYLTNNGHSYRWAMTSFVGSTEGASQSSYRYFQTPPPSLSPPTITSPGGTSSPGPIESDLTPTFRWNSVSGATGYGLYIRDLTTNTVIYSNPGGAKTGTSFTLPSGYLSNNGHAYRWAMTSFSGSTESAQSSYLYFQSPAANQTPTSGLANQYRTDTGAAIPLGSAIPSGVNVNFKATVNDADGDTVKLEVELRQLTATFTGVPTHSSSLVSSGSQATTATATGLAAGNWGWRYRVVDSKGAASGWSSIGNPDFSVTAANQTPTSGLANQYRTDTGAAIPLGSAIPSGVNVNFKATVNDADGDTVKLEVELRQLTATFTGVPTHSSSLVSSGSQATTATATGLAAGNWGWRYRVVDSKGAASGWSSIGNPDFSVQVITNQPPSRSGLDQYRADTNAVIPKGGTIPSGVAVVFKATLTDPDGDTARLEVEVRQVGGTYTGTPTHTGSLVSSGSVASVAASGLASGNYGYKARAVDSRGNAGDWSNAFNPDFVVGQSSLPGVPVTIAPGDLSAPGSVVTGLTPIFSWNAVQGATGYGLYVRDITTGILIHDDDAVPNVITFTLPTGKIVAGHQYRWNMRAKNGNGWGSMTGYRYFQTAAVISVLPKPLITGVSKNPVTGSNLAQPFTITGTNFAAGASVTLLDVDANYPYPNRVISNRTTDTITINPVFTTMAGRWTVQVINGPGKESEPFPFDVVSPTETEPKISEIKPNPIQKKTTPTVVNLTGIRFGSEPIVVLRSPVGQTADISPSGSPSDTSLTFSATFDTPGFWSVRVRSSTDKLSQSETIQVLDGQQGFKLAFPLAREGLSPYTAPISSVFDHSMGGNFGPDSKVVTHTGEIADIQVSESIEPPLNYGGGRLFSYKNTANSMFLPNVDDGNYVGTTRSGPTVLNYDGHPGIDYSVPIGSEVIAAASGLVMADTGYNSSNGKFVRIDHAAAGYETVYLHLSRVDVNPGQTVKEGEIIGLSGNSGNVAAHLHFQVYRKKGTGDKLSVDPYGWRGSYADPRLAFDNLAPTTPLWRESTLATTVVPDVLPVVSTGSPSAGTINVGATGGSYTAVVTDGGDWFSLASGSVGGESGTIHVATTTNSGAGRSGEIQITNSAGAVKTVSVVQDEAISSTNPTPSQIATQILVFSRKFQIPAPIIAAVMTQESSWRQFDASGLPLASKTSDVGIMQLNLNSSGVDAVRASRDWVYNLEEGCKILKSKFAKSAKDTPSPFDSLEDENPAIFENWFYAVAWYNGEGAAAYDYVTKVWGFLRQFPSPASEYFSNIPTIGDPTHLQGFPREILPKISVSDPSLNEAEYIIRGGTSLLLLRKSGESIHSWNWLANSVSNGPLKGPLPPDPSPEPLPEPQAVEDVVDITEDIGLVPLDRTYDDWKYTPGFPIGYEGPSEDPDGDGMTNQMEFALGTSPIERSTVPPFRIDTSQSPPRFVFNRAKHTLGVALAVEGSTTLNGWSGTYVQKSLREESSSIQTWEAFLPSATMGFFRLRLFDPPEDIDHDGIDDAWETDVFGSLDNMSPFSDYGKIGISDFLKFALGMDPRHPDWSALPHSEVVESGGKLYPGFQYRRLISPGLLVYQVGVSDDLVFWDWTGTKVEHVGLPAPTGDGRTEEVTIRLKVPVDGLSGSKFMRMRVLVDQ